MDDTSKTMLKAADVMEERGWNSGYREGGGGTVCVLGALNIALGVHAESYKIDTDPVLPLVAARLSKVVSLKQNTSPANQLARWSNDASGPIVINALRNAARLPVEVNTNG